MNDDALSSSSSSNLLPTQYEFVGVSIFVALLTMVITGLIMYSFCAFKSRLTYEFQLITYLAFSDFIFALAYLPGYWVRQVKGLCLIQGYLINTTTMSSLIWTTIITHIMYISTVLGKPRTSIFTIKRRNLSFVLGYLAPVILCALPFATESYGKAGLWCWLGSEEPGQGYTPQKIKNSVWAIITYVINISSMIYTIVLYVKIWNWMEAEASEAQKSNIKLISLIPLVHFIALFQGLINRLYDFTSNEWEPQRYIVALFWLQAGFDFIQRITVGFMFGLNPAIMKLLKRRCCGCCYKQQRGGDEEGLIPFGDSRAGNPSLISDERGDFKKTSKTASIS